jgi:hypothetical protein
MWHGLPWWHGLPAREDTVKMTVPRDGRATFFTYKRESHPFIIDCPVIVAILLVVRCYRGRIVTFKES